MLASDFIVNTTLDTVDANPGDGIAADSEGRTSLRAAIMEANALVGHDTITLPEGYFELTLSGTADDTAFSGDLDITDDLTIAGQGSGKTVIDAGGDTGIGERVFHITQGPGTPSRIVSFEGLELTGGRASGTTSFADYGGGIRIDFFNDVSITDVIFRDNQAPRKSGSLIYGIGGAIYTNGSLEIRDSRFEDNIASNSGGAIYSRGSSGQPDRIKLDIVNTTFTGNSARYGGALEVGVPTTIESSTLDNNTAISPTGGSGQGGAIDFHPTIYGNLSIVNSTITGNRAAFGGGISYSLNGSSEYHDITIKSSTIAYNAGGGIEASPNNVEVINIGNSIIAKNRVASSDNDVTGTVNSLGGNLLGDPTGSTGFTAANDIVGTSTVPLDPLLGSLADNGGPTFTHALLAGSQAIDNGNIAITPVTDQRGVSRPQGTQVDIGAFELEVETSGSPVADDLLVTIDEDVAIQNGILPVSDPDGDAMTYKLIQAPSHGNAGVRSNGTFFYVPAFNYNGSDSFIYLATDSDGNADTGTINITITPINDPPFVDNKMVVETNEDEAVTAEILYLEAEGEAVTFQVVSQPGNGVVVFDPTVPGKFTFTPSADFNGTDTFVFRATDEQGQATDASVTLVVAAVNDAPVAVDDQYTVSVGESLSLTALPVFRLHMDSAPGDFVGNGETWDYDSTNANFDGERNYDSGVRISVNNVVEYWDLQFAAAGDALLTLGQYDDATRWPFQVTGENGLDVSGDGRGNNQLTGSFIVYDVNYGTAVANRDDIISFAASFIQQGVDAQGTDPPLTGTIQFNTAIGTGAGVLANDSDIDGDFFTAILVDGPTNGSLTLNRDGTLSYTPNVGFSGVDTFTYKTNDGQLDSNIATVVITVEGGVNNTPPVASDDVAVTIEDAPIVIDVVANDSDGDGDAVQVYQVTQPTNGSVVINGDGTISYTPAVNFHGSDSFTYTITDGNGGSDTAAVTVTVNPVNDWPVASDDSAVTNEDTLVVIDVLANDSDVDGDGLSITGASSPTNGTAVVNADGTITYTPNANYFGSDSFTYTISDGNGGTDTATVTVTVSPVNDDPIAGDDFATTDEDTPVTINVLANDFDLEGSTLIVDPRSAAHGTVRRNADQTVVYTPDPNFFGTDTFDYVVIDGNGGQATATVTVTILPVNDAPVAVDDKATIDQGTQLSINVLDNDTDVEGNSLSIVGVSAPSSGTVGFSGSGIITYTPNANFSGVETINYTVSDGNGGTDVGTLTVTVEAVNGAPVAVDDAYSTAEGTPLVVSTSPGTTTLDQTNERDTGRHLFNVSALNLQQQVVAGQAGYLKSVDLFIGGSSAPGAILDFYVNVGTALQTDTPEIRLQYEVQADDVGDWITIDVSAANIYLEQGEAFTIGAFEFGSASLFLLATNSDLVNGDNYLPGSLWIDGELGKTPINNDYDLLFRTRMGTASSVGGVLLNDSDPDGDPLNATLLTTTTNGTLNFAANGTFTYTPNPDYFGQDSFTYSVSDGNGGSDTATVTLTVTPVNDPPKGVNDTATTDEDTPVVIDVLANDTDVEGDTLSIVRVSSVAHGTVQVNADGTITYTPNPNFYGTDTFTYSLSDGNGGMGSASVTVTVNPVNDPPVASDDSVSTNEDVAVVIDVLSNDSDIDGNGLSVTGVSSPANGTAVVNADGTITYTPGANFYGSDSFIYTISDGNGGTDTATVAVTINPVNDAPVASDDSVSTNEDTPITIDVLANDIDPEGLALTVDPQQGPSHGRIVINPDQTITYTPDPNFFGTDTFTYVAADGGKGDLATVTITVLPINDDPVAVDDGVTTNEEVPVIIAVLGNDSDIDGDVLTIDSVTNPANGSVQLNADGTITYTPTANFHGSDGFTYTISDGNGGTDTASVTVTVNPENDPPTGNDDSASTDEDTAVVINVLANDSDVDGDSIFVNGVTSPANGTVLLNADGTLTYTPAANFSGTDSFTYRVSDGKVNTGMTTVTITVKPVNDAPVARDNSVSTNEDVAVVIDVLINDSDVEGDALTVTGVSTPANGTVVINADSTVTYTPSANFNGNDSFTYTISDGNGGTDTATVLVAVKPVNDIPVVNEDSASTDEDVAVVIDVLANDYDVDGDSIFVGGVTIPANGTVLLNADGTITYTPAANFSGTDSFTYRISDGKVNTGIATVTITVKPVNDAPVARDNSASTNEDAAVVIAVLPNDSDVEGDTLTLTGASSPANGTAVVNADGTITYTPVANFHGSDSFTYTVSDGNGGTDTATVTVTVNPVNDAPVASDDSASTNEDVAVVIDVLANDSDVDGDSLTVTSVSTPASGTAVVNADGTITYTPAANFHGSDSFTYTISDGNGGTDTATVAVTVNPVNDLPVASDDSASTNEDVAAVIDVLVNDGDVDGDALTVTGVTSPASGTAVMNADGTITYTPAANFHGSDSFTYTISDGNGGTDTAIVTVTVSPVNDVPDAVDDQAITAEDSPVVIDVLANDSDVDGNPLTVTQIGSAANGSVVINGDNTITYTPNPNFNGSDSFTYSIADGQGGSDTATVQVTVSTVGDAPVAVDDSATTTEDVAVVVDVLGNDSDLEGDVLTVTAVTNPANGSAAINADGTITYTPGANFHGSDSFTYTISDGNGGTDTATVSVTVNPMNDVPVANDDSASTIEDAAVIINVLTNDGDVDGDSLSITSVSTPANGTAVVNADGTITYTPAANFHGSDNFTYTISDGNGGTDTATVAVTVNPVNDAPEASDDSASTNEDVAVVINVLVNDSDLDGDVLTVSSVSTPGSGTAVINADGTITYTPAVNFHGSDSFTYTIGDGNGGTDTATVSVTVNSVNDAPVGSDDSVITNEDAAIVVDVLSNDSDVDGDSLTVSSVSTPASGTAVVNGDGTITYTPGANFHGSDSFTYTINDGNGGTYMATVSVTVNSVNDAPMASDDSASTNEDVAVVIAVLANDSDVDGDALSITGTSSPANGAVVVNADGTITYTPAANFYGSDSFTYTISDGNGGTDTTTVAVTVNPVNDAPVSSDDSAITNEDAAVVIDVLANDSDVDGDALSVTGVSSPANGTAVVNANGTITYTPNADFHGNDSFTYTISDGIGGTDTATVTVTVNPVNDAPVAIDDSVNTIEDVSVVIDVLTNDTDVDGDSLTVTSVSTPANGSTVINADGAITYTPAANFFGSDSFTYTISDGNGGTDTATVSVTVNSVNDAPVASDDLASTIEDAPVVVDVLANDGDVDGDSLTIASVTNPASGTVVVNADGTIAYTPAANFYGSDSFTYTISDGNGGSDTGTVTVTVNPVNDFPVAIDDSVNTNEDVPVVIDVLTNDSDVDGDSLTVTPVLTPANGSVVVNADGTITYTPNANFYGSDSFTYAISDGSGGTDTATVTVTVNSVNDAPGASDDSAITNEDAAVIVDVLSNDSDLEGDSLTVTSVSAPSSGTAVVNADGTITYTPAANFHGSDSFTYTISDGNGGMDTATVSVTVNPINDVPVANEDSASTDEDVAVVVDVLSNDSDVDGDGLSVTGVSSPASGTVVVNPDGTITYTPVANFFGSDSFTYTISDGNGGTDTATVTVTVNSVNDAPVAFDDSAITNEDSAVIVDVLSNDNDLESDSLTVASVSAPTSGTAVVNADGTITYTPAANFHGSDSFTYIISDGNGGTDTATVTVTVNPVNDAPVANDDSASTNQGVAVTIAVLANDSDIDGDSLTITSVSDPENGSVQLNADGTITYTPNANFSGVESLEYTTSDGAGGIAVATVNIEVSTIDTGNDSVISVTLDEAGPGRKNAKPKYDSSGEIPVFHEWEAVASHVWLTINEALPDGPLDIVVSLTSSDSLFRSPEIKRHEGTSASVENETSGDVRVTTFTVMNVDLSDYEIGDRVFIGTLTFDPNTSNREGLSAQTSGQYAHLETDIGFSVQDAQMIGERAFEVQSEVIGQMSPVIYDHDENGQVGVIDLVEFLRHFGDKADASHPDAYMFDYDRSGRVTVTDFALLVRHLGVSKPTTRDIKMPGLSDTPIQASSSSLLEGEYIMDLSVGANFVAKSPEPTAPSSDSGDSSATSSLARSFGLIVQPGLDSSALLDEEQAPQSRRANESANTSPTDNLANESLDPRLIDAIVEEEDLLGLSWESPEWSVSNEDEMDEAILVLSEDETAARIEDEQGVGNGVASRKLRADVIDDNVRLFLRWSLFADDLSR